MNAETGDIAFSKVLPPGSKVERIATGFMFTEGPVWQRDGTLLFSDMPGDKRRCWSPQSGVSVVREPSNRCNGMTRDNEDNLIVCEHVTSRVVREKADGTTEVVASHYAGKELNSPNDVIVARDGSVLFSDPDWGRTIGAIGLERPVELGFRGVFRMPPGGGELQLLKDDFEGPNGLCLGIGEKQLFVNDTYRAHIRVFDVGQDFVLGNERVFAEGIGKGVIGEGVVDGMKMDAAGNVYVTGPGGIWVFDPGGRKLGTIEVPEEVANLNWGDADWKTLYIAASTSIYRLRLGIPGNRLPYMQ